MEEKQDMNQIDEQEPSQQNRLCKKALEQEKTYLEAISKNLAKERKIKKEKMFGE